MATLPWDAIVNILSRLRVEDLLRYRCVSKPWRSLIDSSDFIKMQLNQSMENSSNFSLIRGSKELHSVDLDSLDSAVRLNPPLSEGLGKDVLGRSNGLLALTNKDGNTAIWNPATEKYRKVPISDYEERTGFRFELGFVGFGYDPVNDDYKLFRMIHYVANDSQSFYSKVNVYSLKSNTWKRIGDFPYKTFQGGNGILVGTSLNWMMMLPGSADILAGFDLVTEEYCEILLRHRRRIKGKGSLTRVTELGGWLCEVTSYKGDEIMERVEIWIMKEYGVKESWTKLFSVVPSNVTGIFEELMPLAYLKSVNQVLFNQDGEKLLVYDLKMQCVESVKEISGSPISSLTLVYVKSVVGVGVGDEGNNGKKAGENGDKSKVEEQQLSGKKRDGFLSKGFKLVL